MRLAFRSILLVLLFLGSCQNASPQPTFAHEPPPKELVLIRQRGRLFAGDLGTCLVREPGVIRCWGTVPPRIVELAERHRAVEVAFFRDDGTTRGPLCVLDGERTAHCEQGYAPPHPGSSGCETPAECIVPISPIVDVHAMWKVDSNIVLVRTDGTACVVNNQETFCTTAVEPKFDAWGEYSGPDKEIDLRRVRSVTRNALVLDSWTFCSVRQHGAIECGQHSETEKVESFCPEPQPGRPRVCSDEYRKKIPLPELSRYDGTYLLDTDGFVWARPPPKKLFGELERFAQIDGFKGLAGVAANEVQVCGHRERGPLFCQSRSDAELGTDAPTQMSEPSCVAQLVTGHYHFCAQSCDDRTYCWGLNSDGQLREQPEEATEHVLDLRGATQLTSGWQHTCALTKEGAVWCWGDFRRLHLGTRPSGPVYATPERVPLPARAHALSAGDNTTCAILDGGRIRCWGHSESLYFDEAAEKKDALPQWIPGVTGAEQVAVGASHGCARRAGSVLCWGANYAGGLGQQLPDDRDHSPPIQVPGVEDAVDIHVGAAATCAILADGTAKCWGAMWTREGIETTGPVDVPTVRDAREVMVGNRESCFRTSAGTVRCGEALKGELEIVWPEGATYVVVPSAGTRSGHCAVLVDGTVRCRHIARDLSAAIEALSAPRALAIGYDHACAIRSDGRIVCVGSDYNGQLGTGRLLASAVPLLIEPAARAAR